jgi:hypothetical protein
MVAASEKTYTVEEFMALPHEVTRGCELLNGRITKKHVLPGFGRPVSDLFALPSNPPQ